LRDKIRSYIFENFLFDESDNNLGDEDSLLEKGIIDSTGVLELVMFLEENFNFNVHDDELIPENLDSVNNLVAFIDKKQAEQKA